MTMSARFGAGALSQLRHEGLERPGCTLCASEPQPKNEVAYYCALVRESVLRHMRRGFRIGSPSRSAHESLCLRGAVGGVTRCLGRRCVCTLRVLSAYPHRPGMRAAVALLGSVSPAPAVVAPDDWRYRPGARAGVRNGRGRQGGKASSTRLLDPFAHWDPLWGGHPVPFSICPEMFCAEPARSSPGATPASRGPSSAPREFRTLQAKGRSSFWMTPTSPLCGTSATRALIRALLCAGWPAIRDVGHQLYVRARRMVGARWHSCAR